MNTLAPTRQVARHEVDKVLDAAERALVANDELTDGPFLFMPDVMALEREINGQTLPDTSAIAFGPRHVRVYELIAR